MNMALPSIDRKKMNTSQSMAREKRARQDSNL